MQKLNLTQNIIPGSLTFTFTRGGGGDITDIFKSTNNDEGIQLERHRFKYRNSDIKKNFLIYSEKTKYSIGRKINICYATGQ